MTDEPTRTLDDGSVVRSYQPSNGTEGDIFHDEFCNRCACEPSAEKWREGESGGCEILALTMALRITDPDYPPEWVEKVEAPHAHTCTAFKARPLDWDGVAHDPRLVQAKQAVYDQLPRDPKTGRPIA